MREQKVHLDANILINLPSWIRTNSAILEEIGSGVPVSVSAVVWFEILSGPVTPQEVALAGAFVGSRVIPTDRNIAERAAELFNLIGRKRSLSYDCLIAATALIHDARLVSYKRLDFAPFVEHGLELV